MGITRTFLSNAGLDSVEGNTSSKITLKTTGETDTKEKEVVLDGPLSKIYTDSLNLVYAQEENMGSLLEAKSWLGVDHASDDNPEKYYIYVADGDDDDIDTDEVEDTLRLALDSKEYNKVSLVIEHTDVTSSVLELDKIATKLSIETIFNSENVYKSIINFIYE